MINYITKSITYLCGYRADDATVALIQCIGMFLVAANATTATTKSTCRPKLIITKYSYFVCSSQLLVRLFNFLNSQVGNRK